MLTLHHAWRSSASRRVRLCLAEKGLAFESKLVDLTKGEHNTPEYLKLNPNGVIPLLVSTTGARSTRAARSANISTRPGPSRRSGPPTPSAAP
jgi:hypothetical protein